MHAYLCHVPHADGTPSERLAYECRRAAMFPCKDGQRQESKFGHTSVPLRRIEGAGVFTMRYSRDNLDA